MIIITWNYNIILMTNKIVIALSPVVFTLVLMILMTPVYADELSDYKTQSDVLKSQFQAKIDAKTKLLSDQTAQLKALDIQMGILNAKIRTLTTQLDEKTAESLALSTQVGEVQVLNSELSLKTRSCIAQSELDIANQNTNSWKTIAMDQLTTFKDVLNSLN